MAMTYEELKKQKNQETLDFHGISKWHEMGFKGKGINFLELESPDTHGKMVADTFKLVAPESNTYLGNMATRVKGDKVLKCDINCNGEYVPIKEFIEKYNIHIIGASLSNESEGYAKPLIDYLKKLPVIYVGSAGNDGGVGVTGVFEYLGIMSGAIYLDNGEIKKERYSGIEDTMDFATLHGVYEGTSFSSPTLAGMIALIMQRYGLMSQLDMYAVLKDISLDVGEEGHDPYFGHGVPILPERISSINLIRTDNIMGVPLIKDPIHNFDNRESYPMTPEYITIHNFSSDDIAEDVTEYVDNTSEVKSWHFTVGKDKIYQELPLNLNGWHSSDGLNGTGNRKSIGIEIEENYQAMDNAAKLVAYLQLQNDYEIKTHQDWSGKYCPRWILDNYSVEYFKNLVEGYKLKFKDVPEDKWSFEAIDFVTDLGLMKGFPDGTFKPNEPLTREQMAQVLYNLKKV
jgi:hypothetical protein